MNKVILMGRLTRDPEVRYGSGANATAICRYSIAVDRSYKRDGEPDADFFNIVAFDRRGEFAGKYFRKGMRVLVEGSIRNNSYTDKDGNKRYSTEIIVDNQEFCESKSASANAQSAPMDADFAPAGSGVNTTSPVIPQTQEDGFAAANSEIDTDSDLPF